MKCVFHLSKTLVWANQDQLRGYKITNDTAECDFDAIQARGLVEFWFNTTKEHAHILIPPLLLQDTKCKTLPEKLVTNLTDPDARIVKLTGGKGCSLALLTSLESDDVI